MAKTNPARGMRDFLPVDVRKRDYVIGIIKQVYESYGYEPLETPAVENIETLMGKYGEEGNQLVFKILKRGDKLEESLSAITRQETRDTRLEKDGSSLSSPVPRLTDLALRYDLTVPLARVVADRRNELPKFFKRYQIQPVWRADRPARGRFREFYQCDVDAIGSNSVVIEAELILAVSEILKRLKFEDFTILINHRKMLAALLEASGIPGSKHSDALIILDKAEKIGVEATIEEFEKADILQGGQKLADLLSEVYGTSASPDRGIGKQGVNAVIANIDKNRNQIKLEKIQAYIGDNEDGLVATSEIKTVLKVIENQNHNVSIGIDPGLARGLSYYTGTILEIVLTSDDFTGSIGGGGRYDGLIGMFGKEQIPACGFSLGLERILVVMDERGMFPPEIAESRAADVMVTIWNEESVSESLKLADELRKQGLRVLVYPEADKLGKQIKYADSIGVPFVCVLGESEITDGKVTVKNMKTGEQATTDGDQAANFIMQSSG